MRALAALRMVSCDSHTAHIRRNTCFGADCTAKVGGARRRDVARCWELTFLATLVLFAARVITCEPH
jgi:hypothetical protein